MQSRVSDFYCATCSLPLAEEPCIIVEKVRYCFTCAKAAHQSAYDRAAEENRKIGVEIGKENAARDEILAKHSESWDILYSDAREHAKAQLTRDRKLIVGMSVGLGGIIALFGAPHVGFMTAIAIWIGGTFWAKKSADTSEADYIAKRPIAKPPSYPESNRSYLRYPAPQLDERNRATEGVGIGYSRIAILKRDQHRCRKCGRTYDEKFLDVHHVLPRSRGGGDLPTNLVTLCHSCHVSEAWFGHRHFEG